MIISNGDGRFYNLTIKCGKDYPKSPPQVAFVNKINLPCVDQKTGEVTEKYENLANWNWKVTLESFLLGLKNIIDSPVYKNAKQYNENDTY